MVEVALLNSFSRRLSSMHNNSGMPAAQGARMSPGNCIQTLHPVVPHEIHTSVIKKLDHSVESFVQRNKTNIGISNNYIHNSNGEHKLIEEQIEIDDFSDHDSHYSEDLEDIDIEQKQNMTKQLTDFATMVSIDIQKLFGRKKGEDDSCEIYENKWVCTRSGRESYYADLMKIVQGDDTFGKSGIGESSPLLDISHSGNERKDNRNSFSRKPDKKLGAGPLNELFEYGLRQYLSDHKLQHSHSKEIKRLKNDRKIFENVTPMQNRKLPTSFWREPGSQSNNSIESKSGNGNSVLHSNNTPDFSDLLEGCRLDRSEFNVEISSREVSLSPESV